MPGVFHPGLFFSTSILLNFLDTFELRGKKVLELGAGTGLLSLVAATKEAVVTASDISKTAIENIRLNAKQNNLPIHVIESDLFAALSPSEFDIIVINPPFYPHDPIHEHEHAWYCGVNHEYFQKLFSQLKENAADRQLVFMILSEDCDIERIRVLAMARGYKMHVEFAETKWFERNYVFRLLPK